MSLRQSGAQKVTNFVNAINGLISSHNSSSTAHSTEMAKKVNVNQGTSNNGKFLKVSSGNVVCESVTIPNVTGKADKSNGASQITDSNSGNYSNINTSRNGYPMYDDPASEGIVQQTLNERINLQLGYKSETTHNHSGTYAPVSHNQASSTITDMSTVQVVVTYTDNTSETLTLFKQVSSQ